MTCNCPDQSCTCRARCTAHARTHLTRIDLTDARPIPFCRSCATEAQESGLYRPAPTPPKRAAAGLPRPAYNPV